MKGAFQVVHSYGSIEVMLAKSSPSPVQQHCAGLPKPCSNQIWERVAKLLFPAWNGDLQNFLGKRVNLGKQLNHCSTRAALRLLFDLQHELSEPTLIGAECFPWKWFTPAGV